MLGLGLGSRGERCASPCVRGVSGDLAWGCSIEMYLFASGNLNMAPDERELEEIEGCQNDCVSGAEG